jgi:uncharacterized membrane protein YhaH (DUF805 family)
MNRRNPMPGMFPQPYRGQPRPKYPKPKKQTRNLRREKIEAMLVFIRILFFLIVIFGIIITLITEDFRATERSGVYVISLLAIIIIALFITKGIFSINKFRRGYDIDTSSWEEKEDSEHKEGNDD